MSQGGETVKIQVDKREKHIDKIRPLFEKARAKDPSLSSLDIIYKSMNVGDYLLENGDTMYLIERKAIEDLCSSDKDDLKLKFAKMRAETPNTALLIEGTWKEKDGIMYLWRGNIMANAGRYDTFSGFLEGIQDDGTKLIYTMTIEETISRLCHLVKYIGKMNERCAYKALRGRDVVACLAGIGPTKAKELSKRYSTPGEALDFREKWLPKRGRDMLDSW